MLAHELACTRKLVVLVTVAAAAAAAIDSRVKEAPPPLLPPPPLLEDLVYHISTVEPKTTAAVTYLRASSACELKLSSRRWF